jgi:hypothetical protein
LQGQWGDAGIGGPMYALTPVARRLKNYYAFSTYQDKGSAVAYHFIGENTKWVSKWDEIMADLGPEPKKIAIYPYGSVGFYGTIGNVEKVSSTPKTEG